MSAIDPMKDRVARSGFIHPTEPRCELQCHECGCFVSECRCAQSKSVTSNTFNPSDFDRELNDIEFPSVDFSDQSVDFPRTESARRYLAEKYSNGKEKLREIDRLCFWIAVALGSIAVNIVLIIKDLL